MWNQLIAWLTRVPVVEARWEFVNERDAPRSFFVEPWGEQFEVLPGETIEYEVTHRGQLGEFECVPEGEGDMRVYPPSGWRTQVWIGSGDLSPRRLVFDR